MSSRVDIKPRAEVEKERLARLAEQAKHSKPVTKAKQIGPLKIYLLAYNVISAALWANLLYITISFLLTSRPGSIKATSYWTRLVASSPIARSLFSSLPSPLAAGSHYLSGSYNYKNLGWLTKWTQTLAVLEVVHAALGWVRSPVLTTASQVASRVYTVWGVVEAVPKVSSCNTLLIDPIKSTLYNNATRLVTYRSHSLYLLRD